MRHEVLMEMSIEQIDQYAKVCGIDVTGKRTKEAKIALIEERRERVADIDVLGITIAVPVRNLHDKRVTDALGSKVPLTDEGASRLFVRLVGQEQYETLLERCTDDDGLVDVEALAIAFATVVHSPELKNY